MIVQSELEEWYLVSRKYPNQEKPPIMAAICIAAALKRKKGLEEGAKIIRRTQAQNQALGRLPQHA